jgi:hypothetical protein
MEDDSNTCLSCEKIFGGIFANLRNRKVQTRENRWMIVQYSGYHPFLKRAESTALMRKTNSHIHTRHIMIKTACVGQTKVSPIELVSVTQLRAASNVVT